MTDTDPGVPKAIEPADEPDELDVWLARHRWAVERVREGVIGAVDEPWRAGLDVLAQAPLPWPAAVPVALQGSDAEKAKAQAAVTAPS